MNTTSAAITLTFDATSFGHTVDDATSLLCDVAALFAQHPTARELRIVFGQRRDLAESCARLGLVTGLANGSGACLRAMFLQRAEPWLVGVSSASFPLAYAMSEGRRHPRRPPLPPGTVYRRVVPALDTSVSFRTVTIADDIDVFHRWMNAPRVAAFWELAGTRDDHVRYLTRTLEDPHVHPLVGCFDGRPFGYFEAYWAKEDRIAPFYEVDDYDRGIHMLVGEDSYRGPQRVSVWLPSLVHYLFLDDPRTRHVVAEPRADNAKMIAYLAQTGFYEAKEFDFPHKRAAMMILSRETFFGQFCP